MILDSLNNFAMYSSIHSGFGKAFEFVKEKAATLPIGKYEIDGENLYVMIVEADLKQTQNAKLETHIKYIDIQIVLDGEETFGWSELGDCKSPQGEFNTEKDILFYSDTPSAMITAKSGQFVIFFPEDGHAPLIGSGKVRKAIVKVRK